MTAVTCERCGDAATCRSPTVHGVMLLCYDCCCDTTTTDWCDPAAVDVDVSTVLTDKTIRGTWKGRAMTMTLASDKYPLVWAAGGDVRWGTEAAALIYEWQQTFRTGLLMYATMVASDAPLAYPGELAAHADRAILFATVIANRACGTAMATGGGTP